MSSDQTMIFRTEDLHVWLKDREKELPVVRGLDLSVKKGGCTGIIGESGCGKSMLCRAVLGVLPSRKWKVTGKVFLDEEMVPFLEDKSMDAFRGKRMTMILQDPLAAFDPRMTIKAHFLEGSRRKERKKRYQDALDQLERMYISHPKTVLESYPFQLSGGMLQRALIALSLQTDPEFLIADEPTTALDCTVQTEILSLLKELQKERGISILLISHDLEVISRMADTLYVMYAGQILEKGPAEVLKQNPLHPYTRGLFRSRPAFSKERLPVMEGRPPRMEEIREEGCAFARRCPFCTPLCKEQMPRLAETAPGHFCRCFRIKEVL